VIHSKELSSAEDASLEQFPEEFDLYRLDELVIAAVAPLVCIHITFAFETVLILIS
jgi:hypothetical protein